MIFWLIVLAIVAAGIVIVVASGIHEGRIDKKIANTSDWLETKATIQNAAIERLDKYTTYPGFAFSYSVNGEYFSGKFFLVADQEHSEELIGTLLGWQFPVQYDPRNPSAWYIAEQTIANCDIVQKLGHGYPSDYGPYRNDGDQTLDLHLDK